MTIVEAVAVDLQKRAPLLDVFSPAQVEQLGALNTPRASGGRAMVEWPGQTETGGEVGTGGRRFARE